MQNRWLFSPRRLCFPKHSSGLGFARRPGGRKARQPDTAIRQNPGGAPHGCLGTPGRPSSPRSRLCAEQNAPSLAGPGGPLPPPPTPLPAAERSRPRSAAPGRLGKRARAAQCGTLVPSSGCAAPSCRHGLRLNSRPALRLGAPAQGVPAAPPAGREQGEGEGPHAHPPWAQLGKAAASGARRDASRKQPTFWNPFAAQGWAILQN